MKLSFIKIVKFKSAIYSVAYHCKYCTHVYEVIKDGSILYKEAVQKAFSAPL